MFSGSRGVAWQREVAFPVQRATQVFDLELDQVTHAVHEVGHALYCRRPAVSCGFQTKLAYHSTDI